MNWLCCEVGRHMDDGAFYVIVFGGRTDEMGTPALEIAGRRLADCDLQHWFVSMPTGEPLPADICSQPATFVRLGDRRGRPIESAFEVRRLMAPSA